MILFFDTETTGLPRDWRAPMSQVDNWPRVIQLAWLVADLNAETLNRQELLIKPDGWTVPTDQFWIDHGFSTEACAAGGVPMADALQLFTADLARSEVLVAHNLEYDHKVLGAEMLRYGVQGKKCLKICTKDASTDYCKIPFEGQKAYLSKAHKRYKWPKLSELHTFLFAKEMTGGHQAGEDVTALKDCFFELVRRQVITLPDLKPATP